MEKIIGKCCVVIGLFLSTFLYAQEITLNVVNAQGAEIDTVTAGKPFVIEVAIAECNEMIHKPEIKGLQKLTVQSTGMYMNSINGASTVKHRYTVRADQVGTYKLGPATIAHKGALLTSNVKTITVAGDEGTEQRNDAHPAFVRLLCDTKNVVVGQRIVCTLRFYFVDQRIQLKQIGEPRLVGLTAEKAEGPFSGKETEKGVVYDYVEWRWSFCAPKPGNYTIPAYSIDYQLQDDEADPFSSLSFFFPHRARTKRVYSNAIKVTVRPLPEHTGVVHGVGMFKTFTASLKPSVAHMHEGMVLTLCLEGDGNMHEKTFSLVGMPDTLKWYDSQVYTRDSSRYYEFIVQGLQAGEWELEPQTCTYFDVESNAYTTLRTAPLTITILPDKQEKLSNTASPLSPQAVGQNLDTSNFEQATSDVHEALPLDPYGKWYMPTERSLSSWIFIILLLIPLSIWLFDVVRAVNQTRAQSLYARKEYAFEQARRRISRAQTEHDPTQLYDIFIELFIARAQRVHTTMTLSDMELLLVHHNAPRELMSEWASFFDTITEAKFFDAVRTAQLFDQSRVWVDRLQEVLS